jgi:hypothetical protein
VIKEALFPQGSDFVKNERKEAKEPIQRATSPQEIVAAVQPQRSNPKRNVRVTICP